ncbi:hypothetical protein M5689_005000 [Euphorbia peplus]|nr:hypothetical protein M5689_005000 [Euphorbia peplus]
MSLLYKKSPQRKFDIVVVCNSYISRLAFEVRLSPVAFANRKQLEPLYNITVKTGLLPFQSVEGLVKATLEKNRKAELKAESKEGLFVLHELHYKFFRGGLLTQRIYSNMEK